MTTTVQRINQEKFFLREIKRIQATGIFLVIGGFRLSDLACRYLDNIGPEIGSKKAILPFYIVMTDRDIEGMPHRVPPLPLVPNSV